MIIKLFHFCLCFCALYFVLFSVNCLKAYFLNLCGLFVLLYFSQWLMETTRKYFSMKLPSEKRAVLITGCDSGFGNFLAKRLDDLGYHVFAGCLFVDGEGARRLKSTCSSKLQIVEIDVTNDGCVQDAFDTIKKNVQDNAISLWAVVNNAGVVQTGDIDWCPFSDFQKVMEVNTMGMLRVTKAFLPLIKKSKGRFVNMCSHAGRKAYPGFVGYAMSKSAAISFTEGLRIEMRKWDVDVIGIEPYFYRTPLTSPEAVANQVADSWKRAPEDLKNIYGKEYLESFKKICRVIVGLSSTRVEDVLECMEDAVMSVDPHSVYFPCYAPHKAVLRVVLSMPSVVIETIESIFYNFYTKLPQIEDAQIKKD